MIVEASSVSTHRKTVVVIGHGMVGHRFCEKMIALDREQDYRLVTFCEESRAAYDRVGLSGFFTHRDAEQLMLARMDWYRENGIELHVGHRAEVLEIEAVVDPVERDAAPVRLERTHGLQSLPRRCTIRQQHP